MNLAHLINYLPTFIYLGFNIAILVLSIIYYVKCKKKPFLILIIAFILPVVSDIIKIIIDYNFLGVNLTVIYGYTQNQAAIIVSLVSIPFLIIGIVHLVLLLLTVIYFYKEIKI